MCISSIIRIGIVSNDVFKYKIQKNECIKLTLGDKKLLDNLEKKILEEEYERDILFLKGLDKKMEIEILTSYKTRFIINYLQTKLCK